MKIKKILLGMLVSVVVFTACEDQQEVVPEESVLTSEYPIILMDSDDRSDASGRAFNDLEITFITNGPVIGSEFQPRSFGDLEVLIEPFARYNSNGAYSFLSGIGRNLIFPNDGLIEYQLGFRIPNSNVDGRNPNGTINPAFSLPTTTPAASFAPSPDSETRSDADLANIGLKRLYAFINRNGRDLVFSAGEEAQNLLINPDFINVSRGVGRASGPNTEPVNNVSVAALLETPQATDLLIFTDDRYENTVPLFRYSNTTLGTRVHIAGENNPEIAAFERAGFRLDGPEIGWVIAP